MIITDLRDPVTASKADWLSVTTWMGFTPTGQGGDARERCEAIINRQIGNGYVLEYVTEQMSVPNPGFKNDPDYLQEREVHKDQAGRLLGIHRLRHSFRPLEQIIGADDFEHMQDMWAVHGRRVRWSVAFPIVESYRISDMPKARDVFGDEAYRRLYAHPSALLRELNDDERSSINGLEIERSDAPNAWIAIEDEFEHAERSDIRPRVTRLIERDLAGALEGVEEELRTKTRKRAAWLANRFVIDRRDAGALFCDDCGLDPQALIDGLNVSPRSLLDVHHKNPLEEGIRYTTTDDFALLCPTCHRLEHLRMKSERN